MGLKGWGPDIESSFEEAAAAMLRLMADTEGLEAGFTLSLECEAEGKEDLLVEFLNSIITALDLEEAVGTSTAVERLVCQGESCRLSGSVSCVRRNEAVERLRGEVKAATSYGAKVERNAEGGWVAVCVVDM
jgi:SHS2 domain-containing protein